MSETVNGDCLCGNYHYEFAREQIISAHHCHCQDCRKMTGSGKATIVLVPTEAVQTRGELKSYTVVGTDGAHVTRGFCPECGSQMLSWVEEMPQLRFIKAGTINDSSWLHISSNYWSCSAQPWSPVDTSVPSYEKNPVM